MQLHWTTSAGPSASPARKNQRERLLALLHCHQGEWVPLPAILDLRISQYGTRILELRRAGHVIESRQLDGQSSFRLVSSPVPASSIPKPPQPETQLRLFAEPCQWKDCG
jgi:hypothetical protein